MRLLSPLEVAEQLGVSRRSVYRLLSTIPYVRIGRALRIDERDLAAYLAKHRTERR